MTISLAWFLPTAGDSRTVVPFGPQGHRRPPTIDYLSQVARAAEDLGFTSVLTPTGTWCEDAWLVTAALVRETRRLKFLVAFRPNSISPTLAAQKASTFHRISGGRLLLNIVTGGEDAEQRRFGEWLDHDERYARTDEFLTVLKGALSGAAFDFRGRYFDVEGATVNRAPDPVPLYFGGASAAAEQVAAKHVDVHLTWGEPPAMVEPRLDRLQKLASERERTLRFGIRLHVISRDRSIDAWNETRRFLEDIDPVTVRSAQEAMKKSASVGQQRMQSLHGGSLDNLEISPNLWAGVGLVRGGAGTALVGSHEEVADRIEEYHALGFDEFILSGHPHLEEAFWFGEGVMPILRRRGLLADSSVDGLESRILLNHDAVSSAR
ncbi:MAG: alkanesulfonate monooxygenase [Acidimicrobiales bacterium mtb01]|nr:LLM class flavin-dependent oxidoreductase [Actinomycetota bacterium]TEX47828.1 MAG: alkanesulfonate monooxygenase [Acidimicrobiales bacterium mtb01]